MKLYTGIGDGGETLLLNGRRVPKSHVRICALGEMDELNATLGWSRACTAAGTVCDRLGKIQDDLFRVGAELAGAQDPPRSPEGLLVGPQDVARLEGWIDEACGPVPALRHFILPGGSEASARLHIARAVCRRAERALVLLAGIEPVRSEVLAYLNRLGDLLFAWARLVTHEAQAPEVIWKPPR